jgi:RNA polymerase subunit RPABC4/transcription elongation factor Spt4
MDADALVELVLEAEDFFEFVFGHGSLLLLWFGLVAVIIRSQECSHCHHINPLNRRSQAEFICQACGTTLNADHNGAIIIAQRG